MADRTYVFTSIDIISPTHDILSDLTFTMIKPSKQINIEFDTNCSNAMNM